MDARRLAQHITPSTRTPFSMARTVCKCAKSVIKQSHCLPTYVDLYPLSPILVSDDAPSLSPPRGSAPAMPATPPLVFSIHLFSIPPSQPRPPPVPIPLDDPHNPRPSLLESQCHTRRKGKRNSKIWSLALPPRSNTAATMSNIMARILQHAHSTRPDHYHRQLGCWAVRPYNDVTASLVPFAF